MHSVGLNTHGNPHLTARGLQQSEPTTQVTPASTSGDGDEDSSFGAAVNVTLSANAKAHMAGATPEDGKGNKMNSTAHQARAMMASDTFAAIAGDNFTADGKLPFGQIVSQIARLGVEAATAFFSPPVVSDSVDEGDETDEGAGGEAVAPEGGEAAASEDGDGTGEVALAPAPVAPIEDLLLEEGLLGQPASDGEPSLVEELLDSEADEQISPVV